jgi:hypothetical protein
LAISAGWDDSQFQQTNRFTRGVSTGGFNLQRILLAPILPSAAPFRMPSLIALSLSLITVYIVSHFSRKVKLYSHFLFALRTFEILDTVIPLADFLAGNGFVPAAQAASDFVPIVASRFDECLSAVAEVEVSANLCHCHFVFHFVVISLTHWIYDSINLTRKQALFSYS